MNSILTNPHMLTAHSPPARGQCRASQQMGTIGTANWAVASMELAMAKECKSVWPDFWAAGAWRGPQVRCLPRVSYFGRPGRTRTCYHRLRRPVLYPDELRAHRFHSIAAGLGLAGLSPAFDFVSFASEPLLDVAACHRSDCLRPTTRQWVVSLPPSFPYFRVPGVGGAATPTLQTINLEGCGSIQASKALLPL